MLYKKNSEKELSRELFRNPTCEYRGTPFWAWNSYLEKDELSRQIDVFKEMGLGGFHMHVRTGLENEYMGSEYLELTDSCVEKAKSEEMLAWLYDEDRWPSGGAGGIVTKDHKYRQRYITFTADCEKTVNEYRKNGGSYDEDDIRLLACYDIVLDGDGYLVSQQRVDKDAPVKGTKWYLLRFVEPDSTWHNNQAYLDTLNPEAVKRFIEVTHEKYYEKSGREFGKTIPAIFTDEPQVSRKQKLTNSTDTDVEIEMPWTDRLPEVYLEKYGCDVFEHLPEIIWQLPDNIPSPHRYYYHEIITELFALAFSQQIGAWCDEHGIALTGHMMEECSLESQTHSVGEAMRSYPGFGIPGIDLLCNSREFTTAKQCQSAVHQYGKEGMLSELYGVTGWDCDFRIYKYSGDWQAALGVTVRVPHLSWYAMKGEAKRDYPASISYQSPWYKKYNLIEDHFARLNTALTRGKPVVRVGVIHPVESFWLEYGPNDKTEIARTKLEEQFFSVTDWLLEGSIDFDFISEALLPSLNDKAGAPLKVGEMEYDAVVVPGCETLRKTTIEKLGAFRNAGGKLIFMGTAPGFVDALPSEEAKNLCDISDKIGFTRGELLRALEDYRTLTIRNADGTLSYDHFYQLREDGDFRWLFICKNNEPFNKDISRFKDIAVTVKGEYICELWDTQTGGITSADVSYSGGNTVIKYRLYDYNSLLFRLAPGKKETKALCENIDTDNAEYIEECDSYELSEENVFVLDTAEFSVDGGEFRAKEEILRLDNIAREETGLRKRGGAIVQPWAVGEVKAEHSLTLRFTFESEIEYSGASLALEDPDKAQILFNGEKVDNTVTGNYIDIKIFRVNLPVIRKGTNTLTVTLPLGERTNTENMFILGRFGVKISGRKAVITGYPEKICFGDLTSQGFPFYGGNVTYRFKAKPVNGKLIIAANHYRGALIDVRVDGRDAGSIIYPPYTLHVETADDSEKDVEMTLYIHRYNTFGPIHLSDTAFSWHGPNAWRTEGDCWSYEYKLRPTGILTAPRICNTVNTNK